MSASIPEPVPPSIRDNRGTALRTLRERCAALGVPTWRCDNSGLVLSEPDEPAPLSLLLGSRMVVELISQAARAWGKESTPSVVELFPGAWGVPLLEERRRDRIGVTVGLALSPDALSGAFFADACQAATLDVAAMRRSLLPRARFDRNSAGAFKDLLLWMAQDLSHVEESDHAVTGFTRQLTDCFETIDLLYSLGRSMNDLTQPAAFVANLCKRVQETLSFGWVALWFGTEDRLGISLSGRFFTSGQVQIAKPLERDLPTVLAALGDDIRPVILTEVGGVPIPGSGQVLLHPVMRSGRPVGAVLAGEKFGDDPQVSSYDIQLIEAAAGYVGAFLDNAVLYADQQGLFLGTLEALTASIDAKDRYTCGHSQRVAQLSAQLALAVGERPEVADRVRIAGLVHDVGKIGVPEGVLTKSGRLTDEEFTAIKKHPEIGHRILKDIALLADVLPGVLYHHERWDGRGYPHGLKATEIPKIARYISLADTFDAMSSTRSYRAAMPRAAVLAEIQRCAGGQFDPDLAKAFVQLDFTEYDRMVVRHAGDNSQELDRKAA